MVEVPSHLKGTEGRAATLPLTAWSYELRWTRWHRSPTPPLSRGSAVLGALRCSCLSGMSRGFAGVVLSPPLVRSCSDRMRGYPRMMPSASRESPRSAHRHACPTSPISRGSGCGPLTPPRASPGRNRPNTLCRCPLLPAGRVRRSRRTPPAAAQTSPEPANHAADSPRRRPDRPGHQKPSRQILSTNLISYRRT